jgi:hypothetical protein
VQSLGIGDKDLEDIEFTRVIADSPGTYGFLHSSWGTGYRTHRNIRYEDCRAVNCGRSSAFNPWVTGFDFAELNNIDGLQVLRCTAEGCLESGFHFEWGVKKTNCAFRDCSSRRNGLKPFPDTYDPIKGEYFASGYYLPGGQISLMNCTSEGNGAFGFFMTNPEQVSLRNCTDISAGLQGNSHSPVHAISFFILQTIPYGADHPLEMEECRSIGSLGAGLCISGIRNVAIHSFVIAGSAGIDGKCAYIGVVPDISTANATIIEGIADSSIDISVSSDIASTLVYAYNNKNVAYTAHLVSPARYPLQIEGSGTDNVTILAQIQSNGDAPLAQGSIGITPSVSPGTVIVYPVTT